MGDEGCKVVCEALKANPSLRSLNIAANSAGKVCVLHYHAKDEGWTRRREELSSCCHDYCISICKPKSC